MSITQKREGGWVRNPETLLKISAIVSIGLVLVVSFFLFQISAIVRPLSEAERQPYLPILFLSLIVWAIALSVTIIIIVAIVVYFFYVKTGDEARALANSTSELSKGSKIILLLLAVFMVSIPILLFVLIGLK